MKLTDLKLSTLFELLPAELVIIESGGWPMRVTPEQHKRITALAANYDANRKRPRQEGCWVRTCSLGNRHQGPCRGGNL